MEARSKKRPLWADLPPDVRDRIQRMVGGRVETAVSCPGGYSPGFASRLRLVDGRRAFVKAIDGERRPMHAEWHRTEFRIVSALPAAAPVPRPLGSMDEHGWVAVAFEDVDGREPSQPWRRDELDRVLEALTDLARRLTPSPVDLPGDHPRLGGWRDIVADDALRERLAAFDMWAAGNLGRLVDLEADGLRAARGETLVHFDVFAHNILLTPEGVWFVDWPHARIGAAFVDPITLLSTASGDGIDPDAIVAEHPLTSAVDPEAITGVLAALAGFHTVGALTPPSPGMEAVRDAKVVLGRTTLGWLRRRVSG